MRESFPENRIVLASRSPSSLARTELARIARTLGPSDFPRKFAVELCADCNLACSMCHHPQMRRPKGVMPLPLWRHCAEQIAAVAPRTEVWFSFCGEPLLEPELLLEMLAYGKAVGLQSLNLNSNGMLLTPELSERILDSGVDQVVFGVDGFSREAYERIRVGGVRDDLYAKVEDFLARRARRADGPDVMTQFIEMEENDGEYEAFARHWLARGATVKHRRKLSWGGRFETPTDVPKEERIACPWAVTMMHVFWDGRVPRCPGDTEGDEGVGNAWHLPLTELWRRLGAYRELHLQQRFSELPARCQSCKDWMTGAAKRVRPA
jgi:pyruvate-formate lyase-activating enzyme